MIPLYNCNILVSSFKRIHLKRLNFQTIYRKPLEDEDICPLEMFSKLDLERS